MHHLRQAIWGDIWKHTVEKNQTSATNATMHPLKQAIWGDIWKPTVEKNHDIMSIINEYYQWTSNEPIILLTCRNSFISMKPSPSLSKILNASLVTKKNFLQLHCVLFCVKSATWDPPPGRPTRTSPSSARETRETQSCRSRPGRPQASGSTPGALNDK